MIVKVTAEWRVYILGAVLCVALTICSGFFADRGGPYFMAALTVAVIAYLSAIREFFATPRLPKRVVIMGLLLSAVWHVVFLRLPAGADDDIHRYVWDGRLQRLGYNPYLVIPRDPAAQSLHTPQTRGLNNPDLPSPYPPGAQLFFRAITAVHESTFALKVAFALCDLAIALLLLTIFRWNRQGEHLVLAFAWNPLLAVEVAGSGHIDIVGALLLLISAASLMRRWRGIAAVTFGLAVAVKFLPLVLLPLYWKRVRMRDVALATAVVAVLYVPFLNHGRIPIGSLGIYVQNFRFNGPIFATLAQVAPPHWVAALALLAGFVTAGWLRRRAPDQFQEVFAWPMAASLLCAPVVFPWYLLSLLPFLTSPKTLLIIIWTASIMFTYIQWHLRALGHPWGALPNWVMVLEYGCVAVVGAMMVAHRLRRSGPEDASGVRSELLAQRANSVAGSSVDSSMSTSVPFNEEERS
jgi:alpha-1,6-mannosyltransferase